MKVRTELRMRKAARVAGWAFSALFSIACLAGAYYAVAENELVRTAFFVILGVLLFACAVAFVLWAVGGVNKDHIEKLRREIDGGEDRRA